MLTNTQIKLAIAFFKRFDIQAIKYEETLTLELNDACLSVQISDEEIISRAKLQQDFLQEEKQNKITKELKKVTDNTVIGKAISIGLASKKYDQLFETIKSQYEDNKRIMVELLGQKAINLIIKYYE